MGGHQRDVAGRAAAGRLDKQRTQASASWRQAAAGSADVLLPVLLQLFREREGAAKAAAAAARAEAHRKLLEERKAKFVSLVWL